MEERGVNVDHATLWVIRYAPAIAAKTQSQKRNTNRSWRMDKSGANYAGLANINLLLILAGF
ncbi:[weak similarity to] transposase, partial [methanotrophic bacterial endosymbiont of Bathymodiolus sp.]